MRNDRTNIQASSSGATLLDSLVVLPDYPDCLLMQVRTKQTYNPTLVELCLMDKTDRDS